LVSDRIPSSIGNSRWLISGCEFTAKAGSRVIQVQNHACVHNIITTILLNGVKNPNFETVMAKFSPAYLKKLEELLRNGGYELRYEKGNFKSNYCVLEAKKVVVINKFSTPESRMQSLLEIIQGLSSSGVLVADLRSVGLKNPIQSTAELEFGNDSPESVDPVADEVEVAAVEGAGN